MKTAMYIDDLTAIDFSVYDGKEIRGDSVSLSVMVTGKLDESGMISDFGKIKPRLKAICDNQVDHKLVCDPKFLRAENGISRGEFHVASGVITSTGPSSMYCPIELKSSHYVADIKEYLHAKFLEAMPDFEFDIELARNANASFQYNHGLKLHDGNCQRIIHGHSAELEIVIDGQPNTDIHDRIAARLNGKHFFNQSDVEQGESLSTIRYQASQGDFEVSMPNALLEIVASEPSIENISKHITLMVKEMYPDAGSIRVRVSEGLSKGAVTQL